MDKLNPNLYGRFKKLLREMYDAGHEQGYQSGYQAAQDEPASRLARIALDQAHVAQELAALEAEPDLAALNDSELIRLISYRGYAEAQRAQADAAFAELEQRYGAELFTRLGIK